MCARVFTHAFAYACVHACMYVDVCMGKCLRAHGYVCVCVVYVCTILISCIKQDHLERVGVCALVYAFVRLCVCASVRVLCVCLARPISKRSASIYTRACTDRHLHYLHYLYI